MCENALKKDTKIESKRHKQFIHSLITMQKVLFQLKYRLSRDFKITIRRWLVKVFRDDDLEALKSTLEEGFNS